jgi:hypothetical protein
VGLERSPFSLACTTEELLGRKSSGSGLENQEYGRGDPLRWPRDNLYQQKLALTSPSSVGRPVGIIRSRTEAKGLVFLVAMPALPHLVGRLGLRSDSNCRDNLEHLLQFHATWRAYDTSADTA